MPFFDAEEFSDDIVAEAMQRMLSVYHSEGYPFAQIAPATTSEGDLILFIFWCSKASGLTVGKITLTGNTLSDKNLKDILSLKEGKIYNPDFFDSDRETLKNLYGSLGYLSPQLRSFRQNTKRVLIK